VVVELPALAAAIDASEIPAPATTPHATARRKDRFLVFLDTRTPCECSDFVRKVNHAQPPRIHRQPKKQFRAASRENPASLPVDPHYHPAMLSQPSSIPPGLKVELSRQRLLPEAAQTADEWMAYLNEHREECEQTLTDEHMALEVVFRLDDAEGEWIYWLQICGQEGGALDDSLEINRTHVDYAKRSKLPGWQEATAQNLLCPPAVRHALYAAARIS
jgi:hypothetical protein